MHSGLVNLSPLQLADLKVLAAKRDDEQPMTNKENEELDYLLEQLEHGIPVDGRHPGMVNLTPEQQQQFIDLHEADRINSPPLRPDQKKQLDILKNLVVHGTPLDSNHPGCINLAPDHKKHLIEIERKQDRGQPLRQAEQDQLGEYKNHIAHGTPIDSTHPGFQNLTELEKDKLLDLEYKGMDELTPQE